MSESTGYPEDHVESLNNITAAKGFLGREFLTWLWFFAETEDDRVVIKDPWEERDLEVDLWVEDRLVLETANSSTAQESVMKGGDPSQTEEAAAALRSGKTVKELKIGMNIKGLGEFTAILNHVDLQPRSLKLPEPNKEDQSAAPEDTRTVIRIQHTDTFLTVLDGLFAKFINERVDDSWKIKGLTKMRSWIEDRQPSPTLH
jgi:hypothetical protein